MTAISRLKRLSDTLRWIRPLAGSLPAALWIILKRKQNPSALLTATFNGKSVRFRGIDSNALFEVFHEKEYGFLDATIGVNKAPIVIDVGAHIGTFAVWIFNQVPSARVLSVEADPQTFCVLKENSSLSSGDWKVVNRAASGEDGAKIRFSTEGPTMSHRISTDGGLEIETVSLEWLIERAAGSGPVDVLKVDIEGAEEQFVCAAPHLLSRVRCLVIELHPGLCDTERVRRVIDAHFDSVQNITGRYSKKPLLYCVNSGQEYI